MRRKLMALTALATVLLIGAVLAAESFTSAPPQRRRGGGGFGRYRAAGSSTDLPIQNIPYDGKFTFLRLRFDEALSSPTRQYEFGVDLYATQTGR